MKLKKLCLNVLAIIGGLLSILPLFMVITTYYVDGHNVTSYKLFDELPERFALLTEKTNTTWYTLLKVVTIIALVLAVLYAVLFVVQLCNKKLKHINMLKQVLSILSILVFIVGLIAFIGFIAANRVELAEIPYVFKANVGMYFVFIAPLILGLSGLVASNK